MWQYTLLLVWSGIVSLHGKIPHDMQSLIDPHGNPCQDFYQYACGGWIKSTKETGDHMELSFDQIERHKSRIFNQLRKEKPSLLHSFWTSCMDFGQQTRKGNELMEQDLKSIVQAKTRYDIMVLIGEFTRTGLHAITDFDVKAEETRYSFYLSPAPLTFTISSYSKQRERSKLEKYIDKIMYLGDFKHDETSIKTILTIETELARIHKDKGDTTKCISIIEVIKLLPLTIGTFINGLGLLEKSSITGEFQIYIQHFKYFEKVEEMLQTYSIQDLKIYLAFVLLHSRADWLSLHFHRVWYKIFTHTIQPSRYDTCIDSILENVPDLLGKYYYDKAFDMEKEQNAIEMTTLIKKVMKKHILRTKWMKEEEKENAIKKIENMTTFIGDTSKPKSYPPLSPTDYSTNMYTLLLYSFETQMKKVGQPIKRDEELPGTAALANALYIHPTNAVLIPTAILQPPLFHGSKVHPARNFGAIGTIIGHEITHALDNKGRRYDFDGNKRNWWTESTIRTYATNGLCFVKQYSRFIVDGEYEMIGFVNGTSTLNENIAENGGLSLAWDAYRKHMKKVQQEYNEDEDRMFFLAYAQTWCTKTSDPYMHYLLSQDPHPPVQWRVNGAVMNNVQFSQVFNCNSNTPMNPHHKCQIW